MHNSLYRDALIHGWRVATRRKLLWIYGVFAALLGQFGVFDLVMKLDKTARGASYLDWDAWTRVPNSLAGVIPPWSIDFRFLAAWLGLMLLGLGLSLLVVAVIAQGALIHATAAHARQETAHDIAVSWHAGVRHFWRLVSLQIFRRVIMLAIAVSIGASAINALATGTSIDTAIFMGLFVAGTIVSIVVSFLTLYAACYVLIEEYRFGEAILAAWELFWSHWLVSIEIAAIFFLINIGLFIFLVFGFLLLFSPTAILWVVASFTAKSWVFLSGTILAIFFLAAFIMFVGAVFTVFQIAVWTYLFRKMHHEGVVSRLVHWLHAKE